MAIVLLGTPWEISVASHHVVQNDRDWPGNETVAGHHPVRVLFSEFRWTIFYGPWLHTNQPSDHICYAFRHHIRKFSLLTSPFVRSPSLGLLWRLIVCLDLQICTTARLSILIFYLYL
jgi:hypothetical protein